MSLAYVRVSRNDSLEVLEVSPIIDQPLDNWDGEEPRFSVRPTGFHMLACEVFPYG